MKRLDCEEADVWLAGTAVVQVVGMVAESQKWRWSLVSLEQYVDPALKKLTNISDMQYEEKKSL